MSNKLRFNACLTISAELNAFFKPQGFDFQCVVTPLGSHIDASDQPIPFQQRKDIITPLYFFRRDDYLEIQLQRYF